MCVYDLASVLAVKKWISDGFSSMGTSEHQTPPVMLYALTQNLTGLLSQGKREILTPAQVATFNRLPREVQVVLIDAVQPSYEPSRSLLELSDDADCTADQADVYARNAN